MVNNNKRQLSISSWNVHGLGDKYNDSIFLEKIKSDINILLETWTGEKKETNIPGYLTISKSRKKKKKARRYSGGIIIYYKKHIHKGLTYLKNASNSENRLWIKLDKNFFGFTDDIYLCAIYIPPVTSTHCENDFVNLENEIYNYCN